MAKIDFDTAITTIDGKQTTMRDYEGKVLLIVNVASKCGFTPQYKGLEAVYQQYKDRGLVVLGFPCNQFGAQEPGAESEIAQFCELNFGVTFPMHAKVDVNGKDAHPLFVQLKSEATGILGTEAIKWNFTKFLVARDGTIVDRYASNTTPEAMTSEIEKLLG
ncbi:MAG: glutathione peroxidase [bacterium]